MDLSTNIPKIILPECHRYTEFERLHGLCHFGANAKKGELKFENEQGTAKMVKPTNYINTPKLQPASSQVEGN